jgi:K+-sensing histidine kinase KdpD
VKNNLNVREYIEKKIWEISASFPVKNISYDLDIKDDVIYNVEENTFSILLYNLISNAIKFYPKQVIIKIYASEECFFIQDNGPWISWKNKEKIWDKFYRSDTKIEWFWVGLYLVKRIVDIYDWSISLESNKWKWAKFIVKI